MLEGLTEEIIKKVEKDLRRYPDWVLKVEAESIKPINYNSQSSKNNDIKSIVENCVEHNEEILRKINAIETVYKNRLKGKRQQLIDLRYFQDMSRWEVMKELSIKNKHEYYKIRDFAICSFARVLGYLEDS